MISRRSVAWLMIRGLLMSTVEYVRELVDAQKNGVPRAIASVCSANRYVLEAAMAQAAEDGLPVLIESTVNQVNQFGGYTSMVPREFCAFVETMADAAAFPQDRLILGGDHLGPYPWRAELADEAMEKARNLVAASVRAGYTKIHLDASMPLGGDPLDEYGAIAPSLAAEREADLAAAAEGTLDALEVGGNPVARPVYVIGTEVPPPGGITAGHGAIPATRVDDFLETVSLCREAFLSRDLGRAWERASIVVAQPGVEFGDDVVHAYDSAMAEALCGAARGVPGIVLEAHSTDYQRPASLRRLVEDGVGILKVGPALTFALRECLFGLESIEGELLGTDGDIAVSGLSEALERAMLANPAPWASYYNGDEHTRRLARRFSRSDRCRYYLTVPEVRVAVDRLLGNLARTAIPLTLVSQFLPLEYVRVREGLVAPEPPALLRESVRVVLRDYSAAVGALAA
jgi:D-tagatose-1,6-bisphosphate aldolase subunit GatZ/KbaZ